MSYGAITTEHPIDIDSNSNIIQKSRKTTCTFFAEFLESRIMHLSILLLIFMDILALLAIRLQNEYIELLLKSIFVINIIFIVDVFLRLIVFGPIYFYKGKYGFLHGLDVLLVFGTLGVELFLNFKEKEFVELFLLSFRFWRISKLWNTEKKKEDIVDYYKFEPPAFHIVLVMDRSGSMQGSDIRPLEKSCNYAKLQKSHDNRLGAVYDAVYSFMRTRTQTRNQQTSESPLIANRVDRDTISLILFDDEAEIAFENEKINADFLLNEMLKYETRGGTDFGVAIDKVNEVINKHFDATKTNIVIFLSDGEADVPEYDLDSICKHNAEKNSPLYLHTVLFGPYTESDSLKRLVNIAKKYTPPGPISCQFTRVMDEIVLTNLFTDMATHLREHKPENQEVHFWLFQSIGSMYKKILRSD